ncbi:MAG: YdbL family protein [Gammaproteobacteria bacterium]
MTIKRTLLALAALLAVGCVTINIYFPEAAAQQAADRIIDEVRGARDVNDDETSAVLPARDGVLVAALGRVLDWLVPPAMAQAANFDASSPASRALEQSLKARFPALAPYLDAGAVGLTAAGLLDIRDRNAIPLADRNRVRQLVTEQNTDWEALYQEIARINGHPEWVDQIRKVFAERWVAKANAGWYYRDAGGTWRQK